MVSRTFALALLLSACAGDSEGVLFERARVEFAAHHFAEARAGFQQLLARFPAGRHAATAQVFLGRTYYEEKNFAQALVEEKNAIAAYPTAAALPAAHFWEGRSYFELRMFPEAMADFQLVIAQFPQSAEVDGAGYYLGRTQWELKQYDAALTQLRGVLAAYPQTLDAVAIHHWIGRSLYALKRYAEARPEFIVVLTAVPTSVWVPVSDFYRARCDFELGADHQVALDELRAVLQRYPTEYYIDELHLFIGRALLLLGRYADARVEFQIVPPTSKHALSALYWTARADLALQSYPLARSEFSSVLAAMKTMNPHAPACHLYIGECWYHEAQYVNAEAELLKVLKSPLSASVPEAHYYLVLAYVDQTPKDCASAQGHASAIAPQSPFSQAATAYLAGGGC